MLLFTFYSYAGIVTLIWERHLCRVFNFNSWIHWALLPIPHAWILEVFCFAISSGWLWQCYQHVIYFNYGFIMPENHLNFHHCIHSVWYINFSLKELEEFALLALRPLIGVTNDFHNRARTDGTWNDTASNLEIGRAHVWTPVTSSSRMPSSAWKKTTSILFYSNMALWAFLKYQNIRDA